MLKRIPPCLSPELVMALDSIGHGSRILIADANCDINCTGRPEAFRVRADGISGPQLLEAILKVIPLDDYVDNPVRCPKVPEDRPTPTCFAEYERILAESEEADKCPHGIDYQDEDEFWAMDKKLDLVIASGELQPYGNIYLQKGVFYPWKPYK